MTPYVEFQERLINWLFQLQESAPGKLESLVSTCKSLETSVDYNVWRTLLSDLGFVFAEKAWHHDGLRFPEVILEQINDSGDTVVIRNLPGSPLQRCDEPYDLDRWVKERGSGFNLLRVDGSYSQPGSLQVGDVLVTGERVISPPREGGNGAVLVHLSGRKRGTWLSLPSRVALALLGDRPHPPGLIEDD